jgi:predicted ferric reductase
LEKPAPDWEGESGYITADILERHLQDDRHEFLYLVCGPLPMFPPIKKALRTIEIPNHRIHQERYKMA